MMKTYQPISLDEEPFLEKGDGVKIEEELTWKNESEPSSFGTRKLSSHWIWLAHAILLSTSLIFFALSFCAKTAKLSDAEYTKKYSAWCTYLGIRRGFPCANACAAPAASAVKYETQHFDLPPIPEGPFIGKGDDVDARWDYISASSCFRHRLRPLWCKYPSNLCQ